MGSMISYFDTVESQGASHFSYAVLVTVVNSTNYYKVELMDLDVNKSEVARFNPLGTVDRVDVFGDKNYTGPSALVRAQAFITSFSFISSLVMIPRYSRDCRKRRRVCKASESHRCKSSLMASRPQPPPIVITPLRLQHFRG